jgi:hypothetical protein
MANGYSMDDLLNFLAHASDKGLMPAATATALGVASRNVLGVLDASEREDLRKVDLDAVIKRFNNKRAKDFNPSSLKEYGRRVHRAVDLFLSWRGDPAGFTVKTRAGTNPRKKDRTRFEPVSMAHENGDVQVPGPHDAGGYRSAFPIRPGTVVTISNIPSDLTPAEAERLATFVRMLSVE